VWLIYKYGYLVSREGIGKCFLDGEIPLFDILGFDNNGHSGLCGYISSK